MGIIFRVEDWHFSLGRAMIFYWAERRVFFGRVGMFFRSGGGGGGSRVRAKRQSGGKSVAVGCNFGTGRIGIKGACRQSLFEALPPYTLTQVIYYFSTLFFSQSKAPYSAIY